MALQLDKLVARLRALGDRMDAGFPGDGTLAQAAGRLAAAYADYAQDAQDPSGDRLIAGNTLAMQAALAPAFASSVGTPAAGAACFAAAHTAFWQAAPFAIGRLPLPGTPGVVGGSGVFATELSSIVTAAVPGGLQAALTGLFAAPSTKTEERARAIAQAWHASTLAVVVTITGLDVTPPPAGPLPIVCVGTVR